MGPEKHDFWAILSNFIAHRIVLCVVFGSAIGFKIFLMGPVLQALDPVPGGPGFHFTFLCTNCSIESLQG